MSQPAYRPCGKWYAVPGAAKEPSQLPINSLTDRKLTNQDRPASIALAHGLHDAATLAISAADAKDPAKVLESGEQIDNACERCKQQYWYPHPAQSNGK